LSANLCPPIPQNFSDAIDRKILFDDSENDVIDNLEYRESNNGCLTNLFFGFFFDGTKNNYMQGLVAKNQSNVARVYDCYPGQSVRGVLPPEADWEVNKQNYTNFFRVYVPGVASPFTQIGDSGEGKDKDRGAAFGALGEDRIKWALIQALNNVQRFFYGDTFLIETSKIKSTMDSIELSSWQRWKMDERRIVSDPENDDRNKNTRKVFEDLLLKLHQNVKIHWPVPGATKPVKTNPGQVQKIYVSAFGFSRGAAQARAFVNWFMSLCSLDSSLSKCGSPYSLGGFPVEFDFLGLFDTVASVGIANTLGDSALLRNFDGHGAWADAEDSLRVHYGIRCLHLVSAHEVRRSFPLDSISVAHVTPANSQEVVFPGVHSDLGSGYCPREQGRGEDELGSDMLARIPLLYMYREARLAGVPFKLDLASDRVKNKFKVTSATINSLNAYLETCEFKEGQLTAIMREQGKKQILWHKARRSTGPTPLEKTASFLRATNFDKNDLASANIEFEKEIGDFEEWLGKKPKGFVPHSQKPGFGNRYENEWEEIATWWDTSEPLPPAVLDFFDNYVHDSHAWFKLKDEFPDNESDFRKKLIEWEARRTSAIIRSTRIRSGGGHGNQSQDTPEQLDKLSPEQRKAAEEYAATGEIPRMMTTGREAETFLTFTLRGGYLRFRKVYGGADNILISSNHKQGEVAKQAA
jgi:hypothetical protein